MKLHVTCLLLAMREKPNVFESEAMHSLLFSGFGRGVLVLVHAFRYGSHDKPGNQVDIALCAELGLERG